MDSWILDLLIIIDKADNFSAARGYPSVPRMRQTLTCLFDVDNWRSGCLAFEFSDHLLGVVFAVVINNQNCDVQPSGNRGLQQAADRAS